jgi:YidC/Oxa1 family membrane protein insertase
VERRYALFVAISLAIILAGQLLQARLFPKPARKAEPAAVLAGPDAALDGAVRDAGAASDTAGRSGGAGLDGSRDVAAAAGGSRVGTAADGQQVGTQTDTKQVGTEADVEVEQDAPRERRTLGSLDPQAASGMLVTLSSRGATIERIELSGGNFHDQDDRSGYLGHLAAESAAGEGCRVGIVGPGTPAALAGLQAGDLIVRVGDAATPDPRALATALAATRPGQRVAIECRRDGQTLAKEAVLDRRPLEVVRPEFRTQPVAEPDAQPCDPLSFRLSLDARDGVRRTDPLLEMRGQDLADRDWRLESADATRVRFVRRLPGGLAVAKEYRLVDADGRDGGPGQRLELVLEFVGGDAPTRLTYALDGPTGLPTEGWWYTSRVARDWGSLAVRDVAMRFVGEHSTLVSGLKMADGALDHPASAVREGKPLSFAGVDALYFAAALLPAASGPDAPALEEVRPLVVGEIPAASRKKLVDVTCRLVSREIAIEPGATVSHRYGIFAGPKKPDLLARFGLKSATLDDLVYYGWFGWVARPMIALLHALHAVIGNYGIAILLLTVLVRAAMFPISRKQALSSQKMQVLQPEMKAIAEKYKNDPEKRNRATQELWRKHDYNPMGGCLLVFIQIPIFMGLYRSLATDVELRQAPLFSSAIRWCSNLAAPDMLYDWSKLLPPFLTAPEGYLGPFLNLFPLATIGLFLWQQKLFMPPAVDEQSRVQQQVMKYMMVFMAVMFFKVPCGLCLYFIASSLWGIAERLWLPQTLPATAAVAGAAAGQGRVVDVPFSGLGRKEPEVPAADAARQKRQSRRKQR